MLKAQRFLIFSSIILMGVLFYGCATSLPMKSSINDFVMMSTKTNSKANVKFDYDSQVADGLIKPFKKDKIKVISGHFGFNHTESATLGRMMKEYMGNKFMNINDAGDTSIKATLKDFWLEQYSTDSTGMQLLVAFGGGETNIICVTKVKVLLTINHNGEEYTKMISVSSEANHVSGMGTGTNTSNLYRGKESIQHVHANNINKANNKVVMMMNSYFDEIGL